MSAATVYDMAVSQSVVLAKKVQRSQLRWISGGAVSAANVERQGRAMWTNVLLEVTVEAKLPITLLPASCRIRSIFRSWFIVLSAPGGLRPSRIGRDAGLKGSVSQIAV